MKIDGNFPAQHQLLTPGYGSLYNGQLNGEHIWSDYHGGLSIRAEIAARAMQGILSAHPADYPFNPTETAKSAIEHADALIKALNGEI